MSVLSYDQLTRLADSLYQYVTLDDRGSHNHVRSPTACSSRMVGG